MSLALLPAWLHDSDTRAWARGQTCAALQDNGVLPYYFYLCDMIPFSEHWRLSLGEAQRLQHGIMGYLPKEAVSLLESQGYKVSKEFTGENDDDDTDDTEDRTLSASAQAGPAVGTAP